MPKPRVQHRFQGEIEEKHCSKCKEWKVLKEFNKHRVLWDGLLNRCKVCQNIAKEKQRRERGMKPRSLAEHRFEGALEEKHCLKCDEWKVLKEFNKHKKASDGLQSHCKKCNVISLEKYRRKLGMKPQRTEHQFENKIEKKQCTVCDQWKVLKKFFKQEERWDGLETRCKVCHNIAYKKKMSTDHGRKRRRAQVRKCLRKRIANGKSSAYQRKRRREDPAYAILNRLRRRVAHALKAQGAKKTIGTIKLLGCTSAFFQSYIEKQFVDGMTWENRDKWHIDHRVPCAAFNMLDPLQQRYCFWYKNHQPMWANDNLSKHAKYKEEDKEFLIKAWIFENVFKILI
jgi:hypothetical protein